LATTSENSEWSIDELIKIIATLASAIGTVIYCYALGYFAQLGIPDYPSLGASLAFYIQNFGRTFSTAPRHALSLALVLIAVFFAYQSQILVASRSKQFVKFSVAGVVAAIGVYLAFDFYFVFAPAILMFCVSIWLFELMRSYGGENQKTSRYYIPFIIIFIGLSCWSYEGYDATRLRSEKDLGYRFSQGTNLEVSNVASWLIWVDTDRKYWAHCEPQRSYIYGTDSSGKVATKIKMGEDTGSIFCRNEPSQL
jgi:hypothetical protein